MKHSNYQQGFGETAACTKRMMEAKEGIGQKSIKGGQMIVYFLIVGLPPRRRQKLRWKLVPI